MAPRSTTARTTSAHTATAANAAGANASGTNAAGTVPADRTTPAKKIAVPSTGSPQPSRRRRPHLTLLRGGLDPQRGGGEQGITTAEYAVGTAAGAGLAGLLYTMLTGGLGEKLIGTLFDHALSMLGIG